MSDQSRGVYNTNSDIRFKNTMLNHNNKFKISAPTWNDKFQLPDGSYSVLDIQDYFECILKKHGENTNNPSIRI